MKKISKFRLKNTYNDAIFHFCIFVGNTYLEEKKDNYELELFIYNKHKMNNKENPKKLSKLQPKLY